MSDIDFSKILVQQPSYIEKAIVDNSDVDKK